MKNLPISGIGITVWKDAAEFMALGAMSGCTAAMAYGFNIVQEMTTGLSNWMDKKDIPRLIKSLVKLFQT